jgi:uncharacterized protein (TIGR02231 family)
MLAVSVVPRASVAGTAPMPVRAGQPVQPGEFYKQPIANPSGNTNRDLQEAAADLRKKAQGELNVKGKDNRANEVFNYAATLDQARELVVAEDISKSAFIGMPRGGANEGPTVTYKLDGRYSVPSRNDEQVIEVARIDMAPDYFYKAVPILTPHVYRQANLVNKSKFVLLPGEATMYDGADFVGRMNLPLVAVGEQFTVGFGAEPQMQVQRQMLSKDRTMQGGNQILKFEYRILVSSYKADKVKLQVWDRLPFAENEQMGVTLIKATPEVSKDPLYVREDRPTNLLRWDLEIGPEQNGEKALAVGYEFKLELDKQMTIGAFQNRDNSKK